MRRPIEDAEYETVLLYLEAAVKNGDLGSFLYDFEPRAPYARVFLRQTRTALSCPPAEHLVSPELASRAWRVLTAILTGVALHPGRPPAEAPNADEIRRVDQCRIEWATALQTAWHERGHLARVIETRAASRFAWSVAHRKALQTMLRRRRMRPSDVVQTLVAWELQISVRRVRLALRPVPDLLHA